MFCTKCGKELHDDDRFCAYCGASVREVKHSRYDDVVFNPPFRAEAQRRTEEILRQTEKPEVSVKRETVSFDWNLDGFPSSKPKKTEAVDFNWDSVLENKRESRQLKVEKILSEQELFFAAPRSDEGDTKEVPAVKSYIIPKMWEEPDVKETSGNSETPDENETLTMDFSMVEKLEAELFAEITGDDDIEVSEPTILADAIFGGAGEGLHEINNVPDSLQFKNEEEKFYTYNQKFDAFQQLLEQERERLKALEDGYNKNKESMDYTWIGEIFPQKPAEALQVVDIVAPSLTMAVDIVDGSEESALEESATEEADIQEENEKPELPVQEEQKEEVPQTEVAPSKEKLRYSDIFPRGLVNDDGTSSADTSEAEEKVKESGGMVIGSIYDEFDEADEPHRHIFAKVIITLLIILILGEGVIIAAKFIAPDSKISLWANDIMEKAIDLVTGNPDRDDNPGEETDNTDNPEKDTYMNSLVAGAATGMKTIGEAIYTADVTFDSLSSCGFDGVASAEGFTDADWFTDSEGNAVTYGQSIMDALLRYYDSWQSVNNDETLVGINSLEIGEFKTATDGFYVLCRVTYADAEGGQVEKYQTIHLKQSDETMIINEIKEGNL